MTPSRTPEHAWAYLLRACEPPAPNTARLVDEIGPPAVIEQYATGVLPNRCRQEFSTGPVSWNAVDDDFRRAAELGARLVTSADDEWPRDAFAPAPWAPLALWVRGPARLSDMTRQSVALTGTRLATAYGEHHGADLGFRLAQRGWAIWNSCAHGIEHAAQRGALEVDDARVAAVLPSGLAYSHRNGHDTVFSRIVAQGLVVSEFGLTTPPNRFRSRMRNRLLAALSCGVVIVEANVRSGTRNTARFARELGRPVMALPGPVTSNQSHECHHLIIEHLADLITGVDDIERTIQRRTTPCPEGER